MNETIPRPASASGRRPPRHVPAKFWDPQRESLRVEELLKSYLDLERRLGHLASGGVPDTSDGYRIVRRPSGLESDAAVNARLHAAGFTQGQAQLVYDLAEEMVIPAVRELLAEEAAQHQVKRLCDRFGGADKWRETARQLTAWGRAHLPAGTFRALSRDYEGVLALYRMMSGAEPELAGDGGLAAPPAGEAQLRRMMEDPRYWRDHDADYVARVTEGFKRLYPD